MNIIEIKGITKIYDIKTMPFQALNGIDLSFQQGEFVAIVGPSGSGKTTLLNIIGGLDSPTDGTVIVDGVNITGLSNWKKTDFRMHNIGFVFQSYNLIPVLTTKENIEFILQLQGRDKEDIEKRALELIEAVGLMNEEKAHLNYEYLLQSGIDSKLLPKDAVYYQKPLSVYQKYKSTFYIISFLSLLVILGFLLRIGYLMKIKKIREREISLLSQYKELYHNNQDLKLLLDSIFDNIPIPLFVKEVGKDIRYKYWNKKAEELTGIKSEDVIGKTDLEIFGEEVGRKNNEKDLDLVKNGGILNYDEEVFLRNTIRSTSVIKSIIQRTDHTSYILATRWDITELKAIQHKLELNNRHLHLVMEAGDILP